MWQCAIDCSEQRPDLPNLHYRGDVTALAVELVGLGKSFGETAVVKEVNLAIHQGEFLTLLGPSGSGKTTILRMIAGFEVPTSGHVFLDGEDVTAKAPFERNVNTVFQDYALFPHMSVRENIEYGLRVKGVPKGERRALALEALDSVALADFGERKPSQMSGGQRQRVALARALVNRPHVLLLDEPLGALDLKLREQMQVELKEIQRDVGITFIFVTHDQDEALTMSDRIAVINEGRIEQVGSPAEVYERPQTEFVAGFVGTSNLIAGEAAKALLGTETVVTIRPEKVTLQAADVPIPSGVRHAAGVVTEVIYLGAVTRFLVDLEVGGTLVALQQNSAQTSADADTMRGEQVILTWDSSVEFRIGQQANETSDVTS